MNSALKFLGTAFLSLYTMISATSALAAKPLVDEATGVKFDSEMQVEGTTFRCLGAGVRKFIFINVYAVTFCVDAASADKLQGTPLPKGNEDALFASLMKLEGNKLVVMQLVRDVSAEKLAGAFRKSLGSVLPEAKVDKLVSTIPGDAHDGQTVRLFSTGSILTIDIAGSKKTVEDSEITDKLWGTWIGPDSVSPSLKHSIADSYFAG